MGRRYINHYHFFLVGFTQVFWILYVFSCIELIEFDYELAVGSGVDVL